MQISLGKPNLSTIVYILLGLFVIVGSLYLLTVGLETRSGMEANGRMVLWILFSFGVGFIAFAVVLQLMMWKNEREELGY